MGEIKSVKVDNWGVFFLQKLQNFFNKTDYCDLTLQFLDNSQLKVHRLVLSACTDYFNVLEQNCEMIDDALIMPNELQADVVVPIVNFMYTGTLEFELSMYGKLLKTARDMNMTVLLKLLEAHRRTMEASIKAVSNQVSTQTSRPYKRVPAYPTRKLKAELPQATQVRMSPAQSANKRVVYYPKPTQNQMITKYTTVKTPAPHRGPARIDCNDETMETFEASFDAISYESKPMKQEPDDYDSFRSSPTKTTARIVTQSTPFEKLRQSYSTTGIKRPASSSFESPPEKKPNIQDVKEYSEQQRMRKQIAAEYGDDHEYESILDDVFHNDDDDDDFITPATLVGSKQIISPSSITIKQQPNQKPTIVVKDSTSSKMNHAKIISEVLKKYPHLIKNNKNIKLKIMPNSSSGSGAGGSGSSTQKIIVKKETIDSIHSKNQAEAKQQSLLKQPPTPGRVTSLLPSTSAGSAMKSAQKATVTAPQQPRRIDSKTMHSLIAMGPENTTGPWLCLRCGVNGRPISIPSYRGFRRHLINTHKEKIDARLCEQCGWRSANVRELHHHLLVEHKVGSRQFLFPKCDYCPVISLNNSELEAHIQEVHVAKTQQCIYCNKMFEREIDLYEHMKAQHKTRARLDGVIDFSDDEEYVTFDDVSESIEPNEKIKILSDICLPLTPMKLEASRGIATTLEMVEHDDFSGPKFVTSDGNEMVLTDEQRQQIISQLDQQHEGGVVMVLNESAFPDQGTAHVVETHEGEIVGGPDGNMFVVYNPEEGEVAQVTAGDEDVEEATEEGKMKTDEKIEWEEISSQDMEVEKIDEDEEKEKHDEDEDEDEEEHHLDEEEEEVIKEEMKKKSKDELEMRLKMLTGDWTDDEDEEEETQKVEENVEKEHEEKKDEGKKEEEIEEVSKAEENLEAEENEKNRNGNRK